VITLAFGLGPHVGSRRPVDDLVWRGRELHCDWRNDVEGLGTVFSNHNPGYRNMSYPRTPEMGYSGKLRGDATPLGHAHAALAQAAEQR
jgi:hypothetical protein